MNKKVLILAMIFLFIVSFSLNAQTIIQMGFVIKKALPDVKNIAVIGLKKDRRALGAEAAKAKIITRLDYQVYTPVTKSDILTELNKIYRYDDVAIIVRTNTNIFDKNSIKYIALKLYKKKVPLITDRITDTLQGAMITFGEIDGKIEVHISKLVANAYGIIFPEEFLADAIVDVE